MKTIQISDELHTKLKDFVVDPFDDTPDSVIGRLIEIADKAKGKWSAWEVEEAETKKQKRKPRNKQHLRKSEVTTGRKRIKRNNRRKI
jgi:predicted CopG family antitoxin